jgi:hypothetical protein
MVLPGPSAGPTLRPRYRPISVLPGTTGSGSTSTRAASVLGCSDGEPQGITTTNHIVAEPTETSPSPAPTVIDLLDDLEDESTSAK